MALAETGTVVRAARAAGIDRRLVYTPSWLNDAAFQEAKQRAHAMAADLMEEEVYRRAVEGVERPTGWYKGQPGGVVREFSDVLLMFALKGERPEKYRERVDLRGLVASIDMDKLPHAAIERIANGEHPLAVLADLAERGAGTAGLALPSARR